MTKEFVVRDLRKKDQYKVDDEYLNGYARICGIYATGVYNSLSRHADFNTQQCFPSIELIAEQHGISRPTVLLALKVLELAGIILKKRVGKMKPNEYILVDRSYWTKKEDLMRLVSKKNKRGTGRSRSRNGHFKGEVNDMDITSEVNVTVKSEVNDMDSKDNTAEKDTQIASQAPQESFVWSDYLAKLRKDPKKHVRLIGSFFQEKGLSFENREQVSQSIRRFSRVARDLVSAYPVESIEEAFKWCLDKYPDIWTLDTVSKYLTSHKR